MKQPHSISLCIPLFLLTGRNPQIGRCPVTLITFHWHFVVLVRVRGRGTSWVPRAVNPTTSEAIQSYKQPFSFAVLWTHPLLHLSRLGALLLVHRTPFHKTSESFPFLQCPSQLQDCTYILSDLWRSPFDTERHGKSQIQVTAQNTLQSIVHCSLVQFSRKSERESYVPTSTYRVPAVVV